MAEWIGLLWPVSKWVLRWNTIKKAAVSPSCITQYCDVLWKDIIFCSFYAQWIDLANTSPFQLQHIRRKENQLTGSKSLRLVLLNSPALQASKLSPWPRQIMALALPVKGSWLVRSFPEPRPRSQAVLRKVSTFSWSSSTLSTFSSTFAKSLQSPAFLIFFVSILFASQTSRRKENDIKYAGGQYRKPVLEVRSLVHLQPIAVSVFWNECPFLTSQHFPACPDACKFLEKFVLPSPCD